MAQLPPKIPNTTPNWPELSKHHHHHHRMSSLATTTTPRWNATVFQRFDDERFLSLFADQAPATPCDQKQGNETEEVESTKEYQGSSSNHRIVDPKRVKRILANRQSAQRSRVKKLQYISELERSITTLQAEVSVLSPRVAVLDHQRLLLNVDNSALKQRIAALQQDKIFKETHQEALKREIERLMQVYQEHNDNTGDPPLNPTAPNDTQVMLNA